VSRQEEERVYMVLVLLANGKLARQPASINYGPGTRAKSVYIQNRKLEF
jgi:hypothetical protein